jgi:phosphatidylglycerophosphatase A
MVAAPPSLSRRLVHFIASGFGAGWIPKAPGTFGTLVAIPIYLVLRDTGPVRYIGVVIAMFALGVWICGIAARDWGDDAPAIVWDEIVGYLIAMFLAPPGWGWIVAGFVLFRFFDIVKPFPIRAVERRVRGGIGVMLDDALAGLAALGSLHLAVMLNFEAIFT